MESPKFVVVVGTSAGGLSALSEFVAQLPTGINAAFFIVMHLSKTSLGDFLMIRLQRLTTLKCLMAEEGMPLVRGQIYIAPADVHLLIKEDRVVLGRGPEENRWKPSIDVLFRSAAAAFSTRCIGVILTGLLNDGATGMLAIKRSGGISIIQDPEEAEYPDMPLAVLNMIEVDHRVSLAEMGEVISTISQTDPEIIAAPADVIIESEIAERVVVDYKNIKQLGDPSIYACPDCGGGLWTITSKGEGENRQNTYRCHIGHSYSENDLVLKQARIFESTLWIALRIMEERKTLLQKMEQDNAKRGFVSMAKNYKRKADSIQIHVDKMKEILFDSQKIV